MINFSKEQMYNTINAIANEELNLETARKMIANLVVENADMQKRMYKAVKYMQNKYDNSDLCGFTISFDEFEELKKILKYEPLKSEGE